MATKIKTKKELDLNKYGAGIEEASKTLPRPDAEVDLSLIDIERQVRTDFPLAGLTELAASMRMIGLLEPIILLAKGDGRYRLISGERRVRAAPLAGLTKLPAVIKHDLNERQVRRIQIAENNDRENLSPYDEAIGVAEDVEKFGFAEAVEIWNRSEAWVSKRSSVKKYAVPVIELFRKRVISDLEVLGAMHQLHSLDKAEFTAMSTRLESEQPPSRDDVRNKVTSLKTWIGRQKEADKTAKAKASPAAKTSKEKEPDAKGKSSSGPKSQVESTAKTTANPSVPAAGSVATILGDAPAESARLTESLRLLREEVYEWGVVNRTQFLDIQTKLDALETDLNVSDWILWSGFLSIVLPTISALGENRGSAFVKRLQSEMKGKPVDEIWHEQHPIVDGVAAGPDAPRVKAPDQPDNWRF